MTDGERLSLLHQVLRSYANEQTTDKNKKIINSVCMKMVDDSYTTPKDYVMALADGLLYGNWPWSKYTSEGIK